MRAASIGLSCLALLAGACSLSLDGDHFLGGSDGGSAAAPDPPHDGEELDCPAGGTCKQECERDCDIDCRNADRCEATCKHSSSCTIDCTRARECDHVKCEEDSGCLLDCTGAERCHFDACDGQVTSCPGGLLACNRDCP
jgi:hypothetical protein